MKIFLPFQVRGVGGTSTFALKFKEGLERQGHEVFFEYRQDYDILFLIVQAPFWYLWDAKKKGRKIVQRLDGTYYWSVAGWKFPLYNLKAFLIRHLFTDFTIYQSRYSKFCAERFLGKKRKDPSTTIYNGVDLEKFSPNGKMLNLRDNPTQSIFFTASAFRRKDQILPILEALEHYKAKYGDNFKCLIAGTFSRKLSRLPQKWAHFKQIHFLGKIENKDLPLYERAADVFLFTHLNPPCPNNVIESLACGLLICGIADGAMPELVRNGSEGKLLEATGNAFWKKRDINPPSFADQARETLIASKHLKAVTRERAEREFGLEQMIGRYINVFNSLL